MLNIIKLDRGIFHLFEKEASILVISVQHLDKKAA